MQQDIEKLHDVVGSLPGLVSTLSTLLSTGQERKGFITCCKRNSETYNLFLRLLNDASLKVVEVDFRDLPRDVRILDVLKDVGMELLLLNLTA